MKLKKKVKNFFEWVGCIFLTILFAIVILFIILFITSGLFIAIFRIYGLII